MGSQWVTPSAGNGGRQTHRKTNQCASRLLSSRSCLALSASLAAQNVDPTRNAFVATVDPLGEPVTSVAYLDQNWTPSQSVRFYFTSQGAQILPHGWFLALEQADNATLFRDNQNMLRYRYLAQNAGPRNPDGLAVGFVAGCGTSRFQGFGDNHGGSSSTGSQGLPAASSHFAFIREWTTARSGRRRVVAIRAAAAARLIFRGRWPL